MAEIRLTATPALGGTDMRIGDNTLRERSDLALVSLAIPQGGDAAVKNALSVAYDLAIPDARQSSGDEKMRAIRTGPDQILLIFPHQPPDANAVVQAAIKGAGYTTDQTDVWVMLDIDGPDIPAALERLCPLDLALPVFPAGAAARTSMEHMGAIVLRLDRARFLLMSARSSAKSFLHAVETSIRNVLD